MRTLIAAFLSLLLAVLVTLWVKQDNGYILIGYGHWTLEASLALFLLLDLLAFLLLYLVLRGLARIWTLPERLQVWRQRRLRARARQALTQGLLELAEGNWRGAERDLVRHAPQSETPLLNYLAAARAAQLQGADARRDDYLHLAHQSMPAAELAIGLTQAELQLAHQQYEQALATLMHVRDLSPRHAYVLTLLKRLYIDLGEWEKLQELLPDLLRRKVIDAAQQRELEIRIYHERLQSQGRDLDALERLWQQMGRSLRQEQALLTLYVGRLLEFDSAARAAALIGDALERQWTPALVRLYGQLEGTDATQRLARAEGWLKEHPEDPDLLLALARLCLQQRLWGKARSYLEASLAVEPEAAAYQELGALLEELEEPEQALACYRAGLELERGEAARELPTINRAVLKPPVEPEGPEPPLLQGV